MHARQVFLALRPADDAVTAAAIRAAEAAALDVRRRASGAAAIERNELPPAGSIPPGWIYYMLIDNTIKIGFTKDLHRRMGQYPPTSELLAAEPGSLKIEHERHADFGVFLAHGREWFRDVPEIRKWIATVNDTYGVATDSAYTFRTPGRSPIVGGKHCVRNY